MRMDKAGGPQSAEAGHPPDRGLREEPGSLLQASPQWCVGMDGNSWRSQEGQQWLRNIVITEEQ